VPQLGPWDGELSDASNVADPEGADR
jgi:hypothetical protein